MRCCQFKASNDSVPASGDCMTYDTMRALGHTTYIKCILWIWLIGFFDMFLSMIFSGKKISFQQSHVPVLCFPNCCWWCLGSWWLEKWWLEGISCVLCVVLSCVVVCCIMMCCVEEWRLEGTSILALLTFQQKGDEGCLLFGGECSSWHDDAPNTHLNTHFLSSTSYLPRNTNKVFKSLEPSCAGGNNDIHLVLPVVHRYLH